jgi:hypothetical protein
MTFKFAAKNQQTGKIVTLNVTGARELEARQKLAQGGYEVLHLIRVTAGVDTSVKLFAPSLTGDEAIATVARIAPQPQKPSCLAVSLIQMVERAHGWLFSRHSLVAA